MASRFMYLLCRGFCVLWGSVPVLPGFHGFQKGGHENGLVGMGAGRTVPGVHGYGGHWNCIFSVPRHMGVGG